MKKIRFLLASIAVLLCSLSAYSQVCYDHDFNVDGINYKITSSSDMTVSVTYNGYYENYDEWGNYTQKFNPQGYVSGEVVIPETVPYNGTTYTVTGIGDNAFYDCYMTSVTIPKSITNIGYDAFANCTSLQSVNITDLATWFSIDFLNTTGNPLCYAELLYLNGEEVKDLVVPNTVTEIGENAFYNCTSLTSVTIPNSVTSIGYYAFYGCENLAVITIPNSVTSIDYTAFLNTAWYNNQPDGVVYAGNILYKYKGIMPDNTSITVKEGTVGISNNAFWNCKGLISIELPNSVVRIGTGAFTNTAWYESLPDGVVYVGKVLYEYKGTMTDNTSITVKEGTLAINERAFSSCSSLTSINIPNSVTSIGKYAFSGCSSLTSINIPNGVTNIGDHTFEGCKSLTSINIPNSVTSIGNYAFYECRSLASVIIGNGVTSIGKNAFAYCKSLTSINIPNSVTSIGYYAFGGCGSLSSVIIGDGVASIGEQAFSSCQDLISVTIGKNVTSIGVGAFSGCTKLSSVNITDVASWCRIKFGYENGYYSDSYNKVGNPLYYAKKLYLNGEEVKDLVIPETVTEISRSAFYNCLNLNSVTIPSSVTNIAEQAFYGCDKLSSVNITDIASWCRIKFYNNNCNPLYYAKNLYLNGEELKDLVIPESVTEITNSAFYNCSNLNSITIGKNVASIGYYAFDGCSSLASVRLHAATPISIHYSSFWGGDKSVVLVPSDLLEAYKTKTYWKEIYAAGRLLTTDDKIDYDVNVTARPATSGLLSEIKMADLNKVVRLKVTGTINSYDIIVFNQKMPNIRCLDLTDARIVACDHEYYADCKTQDDVVGNSMFYNQDKYYEIKLPETATSIGKSAFSSCSNLKTVSLGGSVKSVGKDAFLGCSNLKNVGISDIASWCQIGFYSNYSNPLHNAKKLYLNGEEVKDLIIPNTVTNINGYAFYGCSNLTSVIIPNSVTSIGGEAFYGCSSLTSVIIPNSVTSIGDEAFYGCSSLTSVTIPNSVTNINQSTFERCSSLTSVTIPSSVKTISQKAFADCGKLEEVYTRTVEPTYINQNTFSSTTYSNATLYVPKTSFNLYWLDTEWSQFKNLAEYDAPYDNFYVNNDYVLDDETGNVQGTPDVDVEAGSGFIHEGSEDQNLDDVHVKDNGTTTGSIIGNGHIDAAKLFFDIAVNKNKWYFFCFPYKAMLADMKHPGDYVWRKYDGNKRANSGGTGWADMTTDCLYQGEGYIYQTNVTGSLSVEILKEQFGKFEGKDINITLTAYNSSNANNASWNLIGNPFTSYYDINDMGYNAPITIWNGSSYEAIRPGDDDYILRPFEAFFVQKPNETSEIEFKAEFRLTYNQSQVKKNKVAMKSPADSKRFVVNLTISDGENSDKTRVVFNEKQNNAYEIGCDAAKFMSTESVPQLYTLDSKNVKYSINERPEGEVAMGYVANKEGQYTISAVRMDKAVMLKDLERGVIHDLSTGDYTFASEAGTFEGRFVLMLNSDVTGIDDIKSQTGVEVAVVNGGISISGAAGKTVTIYNVGGAQVAANVTDGVVALASGTYIVTVDGVSTKVVVK